MSERIVVVEDERLTRATIVAALSAAGFSVRAAADADACRAALRAEAADLIVLDLGLPGQDGQSYARELRANSDVALLIVTSRSSAEVATLDAGADGFLTKPVEAGALVAHARAVLRRHGKQRTQRLYFGSWTIDQERRTLQNAGGEVVPLTGGEFSVLALLAQAEGRIVSRELLSEAVNRGVRPDMGADPRSVDALVSRLRRKLGSDIIATATGFGYRLAVETRKA
jgi:DNA-binding response OmpR family regulator